MSFWEIAMTACNDDFFRRRLDQLIDLRHRLAVLTNRRPWQEIEATLAHRFARQVRKGKLIEDLGFLDRQLLSLVPVFPTRVVPDCPVA
jgi:hypothetical protein